MGGYLLSGTATITIYRDGHKEPVLEERFELSSSSHLKFSGILGRLASLLWTLPSPRPEPLNGVYTDKQLLQMGAKIVRGATINNGIYGFRLLTDKQGNRYPNHDYRIVIDYPAKLTRLVIGDPESRLEWCEFENGRLVRCNSRVTAMLATQPCYKIFDKAFP